MGRQLKFVNIDLLQFMKGVVARHTKAYQEDFQHDIRVLRNAVASQSPEEQTFFWLCRTQGTWLLRERDVFMTKTSQSAIWDFYIEQTSDPVLAFAVEVLGLDGDTVRGNIYLLDYRRQYDRIKSRRHPAAHVLMQYEGGELYKPAEEFRMAPDPILGELQGYCFSPGDETEFQLLLQTERSLRRQLPEGDAKTYLSHLRTA